MNGPIIDATYSTIDPVGAMQQAAPSPEIGQLPPGIRPVYARDLTSGAFSIGLRFAGMPLLPYSDGEGWHVGSLGWGFLLRWFLNWIDWPPKCVVAPIGGIDPAALAAFIQQQAQGASQP